MSNQKGECVIPQIPLRSDSYVGEATYNNMNVSQCGDSTKFTKFINSSTLVLLDPVKYDRRFCSVFEIERPFALPLNDTYQLSPTKTFDEANAVHLIDSEHVIVSCNVSGTIHLDYHSRVLMDKGFLPSKINHWKTVPEAQFPVSVMVLVLDSISATDAFRQLPRTMNYLLENLNFTYFSRYHALGEATMQNVIPLLVGQPTQTFFQTKKWHAHWDSTEFIWKDFNRSHFATAYMEDVPEVGTFNYDRQPGFVYKPTDFYPRSIFTAWEEFTQNSPDRCIGTTTFWQYLYSYQLEILQKLNRVVPSFTIPWLCWPFHDIFDMLSAVEPATLEFFQEIGKSQEILDNTVIIVMGDHGFRFSGYAQTDEGLIERRLPLFLIRLPKRIQKFLPGIDSILEFNSKQVTSHYDVFQTLKVLSQLGNIEKLKSTTNSQSNLNEERFGRNLFEQLPPNRTCKDAGIPDQWCACNLPEPRSTYNVVEKVFRKIGNNRLNLYRSKPYVDRSID